MSFLQGHNTMGVICTGPCSPSCHGDQTMRVPLLQLGLARGAIGMFCACARIARAFHTVLYREPHFVVSGGWLLFGTSNLGGSPLWGYGIPFICCGWTLDYYYDDGESLNN